ncbi:HAD family phosphatase [Agriterribacter sp.]|uniref:HAD family hydrolase n=1 Tax=Agriterribacter sp. TaxID=2821509 RepID=UPI002D0EF6B7|nr:HAD family phosphatase [Agriterribacter sp.]HRO44540.1 HAD family phosphatase [Agriterribacter sp.]
MQNIENLIFDLGGVILTLDMPRAEQHFTALGVKDYNTLFRSGNVSSFFKDYEVGGISDAEFLEALRNLAALPLTDEELVAAWNAMLGHFPEERIALLSKLKNKYRSFLFSNTNALHLITFRKMYTDAFNGNVFDDHFEKAYYSHLLRMRKPDKESYEHIIRENNLDPSKTVFIDDSILNIEGAEAAGLKGIHIKPGTSILDIDL